MRGGERDFCIYLVQPNPVGEGWHNLCSSRLVFPCCSKGYGLLSWSHVKNISSLISNSVINHFRLVLNEKRCFKNKLLYHRSVSHLYLV